MKVIMEIPLMLFRAIWYYPMLLTIGLIVEMVYGLLIIMERIFKNGMMPESEIKVFKYYPNFYRFSWYLKFIKNGINIDNILEFKVQ